MALILALKSNSLEGTKKRKFQSGSRSALLSHFRLLLQVLQQQLIKAERERILQQIQSGAWPADTAVPVAQLLDEDGEEIDDDELPKIRKLRAAQKQIKAPSSSSSQKSSTSSGGRTR